MKNVVVETVQQKTEPSNLPDNVFIVFESEWVNDRRSYERFSEKYITKPLGKDLPNNETPFNDPENDNFFLPNSSYVSSSATLAVWKTTADSDWIVFDPKKKKS